MQRLELELGTLRLQTVDSTAAPSPPLYLMLNSALEIIKNKGLKDIKKARPSARVSHINGVYGNKWGLGKGWSRASFLPANAEKLLQTEITLTIALDLPFWLKASKSWFFFLGREKVENFIHK
jgi:hypothetical protein